MNVGISVCPSSTPEESEASRRCGGLVRQERFLAARSMNMTSPSPTLTGEGCYLNSSQSSGRVSPMTLIEDANDVYFERKEKQEEPHSCSSRTLTSLSGCQDFSSNYMYISTAYLQVQYAYLSIAKSSVSRNIPRGVLMIS
jgi:hypothetical protein